MSEQRAGKVTAEIFEQVILRRLGARDPGVVVGPAHGVDVGVVRVAPGTVMALTSDPVFIVPAYGWVRGRHGSRSTSWPLTRPPAGCRCGG